MNYKNASVQKPDYIRNAEGKRVYPSPLSWVNWWTQDTMSCHRMRLLVMAEMGDYYSMSK